MMVIVILIFIINIMMFLFLAWTQTVLHNMIQGLYSYQENSRNE